MATVCKWLGFYLCMKEPDLNEKIRTGGSGCAYKCDMVVALKAESPKEKRGGVAFDVILQPALATNPPPAVRDFTPLKKDASQNFDEIARKLRDAEDRRLSAELSKLHLIARDKERAAEASQRVQGLSESFSRDCERKLAERMEVIAGNKSGQIKALQDRLKEHAQRVEDVRRLGEQARADLKQRIEHKLESAGEKRDAQLHSIQERIRKHKQHIDKVLEQSSKFSKDTEEKIIHKMEASVKNRDEQISHLLDRLKEHERRVEQVRLNKVNQSRSNDSSVSAGSSSRDMTLNDDNYDLDNASLKSDNEDEPSLSTSAAISTSDEGAMVSLGKTEEEKPDDGAKNGCLEAVVAKGALENGLKDIKNESEKTKEMEKMTMEMSVCDSESSEDHSESYVLAPSRESTPVEQLKPLPHVAGKLEDVRSQSSLGLSAERSAMDGSATEAETMSSNSSTTNGVKLSDGTSSDDEILSEFEGGADKKRAESEGKPAGQVAYDAAEEFSDKGLSGGSKSLKKGDDGKEKESTSGGMEAAGDASCGGSPRTTLC